MAKPMTKVVVRIKDDGIKAGPARVTKLMPDECEPIDSAAEERKENK